jgi:hypothetical protein
VQLIGHQFKEFNQTNTREMISYFITDQLVVLRVRRNEFTDPSGSDLTQTKQKTLKFGRLTDLIQVA